MTRFRLVFLGGLVLLGAVLATVLVFQRVQPPVEPTLTSAFQVFGETIRVVDRLAGRVMPVDDLDEAAIGEVYKAHYEQAATSQADVYVNELLQQIAIGKQKEFSYEAIVVPWSEPNAMALPGGVVFVTDGLLHTVDNEAQLAAVLAHEVGHIELSHCVDAVKYEITARKLGVLPLGQIADVAAQVLVRHAFSKTQEHEADLYAWTWLSQSRYDPRGSGGSFESLLRWQSAHGINAYEPGLFRDYFSSHPPLEVRMQEFDHRADRWWRQHVQERRYVGMQNLAELSALADGPGIPGEWVTGGDVQVRRAGDEK